jgi:methylmalonyl-CoA epimerase
MSTSGLLTEIDHIAIAVRDLEAAIAYYRDAFGAEVHHREVVESDGVEEALIKVADSYIQLTAATRDDSPIAKAIEKRGEGLHHVGYRVDDCAAALAAMVAAGATPIDQAPRPGSRGTTVAFVHPKGSFGTLIELVQEERAEQPHEGLVDELREEASKFEVSHPGLADALRRAVDALSAIGL